MYDEEEVEMGFLFTWFGHAALGFETDGYHVLVDPYMSDNPACTTGPEDVDADYILISHGHGDHVGDAVEIAKRTGAEVISNFEIAGPGACGQQENQYRNDYSHGFPPHDADYHGDDLT